MLKRLICTLFLCSTLFFLCACARGSDSLWYKDLFDFLNNNAESSPVYISLKEISPYDPDVISQALLTKESSLPEVTYQTLPSSWRGTGLSCCKDGNGPYNKFKEQDIAFLAENGFNFARLFFELSTLRYPDYPQDGSLVNENELKELDQLLAWCIEYDVHLQISASYFLDENAAPLKGTGNGHEGMIPSSEEAWAVNAAYWAAIAKRYAGIDNRYMSFDLINEVTPWGDELEAAIAGMSGVIDAIRTHDPDRVLLLSNPNLPNLEWNDSIAKQGVAIGCHPYYPEVISSGGNNADYLDPIWPMPELHLVKFSTTEQPITLQGAIDGATVDIYVDMYHPPCQLEVYADGVLIQTIPMSGGELVDVQWNGYYLNDKISFTLPESIETVELWDRENSFFITTLAVEGSAGCTVITPVTNNDAGIYADIPPITIEENGSYTVGDGDIVTEDDIYEFNIKPLHDVAKANNVGFMVGEFGTYAFTHWDISVVADYLDSMLHMLEDRSLPWCYCELYNGGKHMIIESSDYSSHWQNATYVDVTPVGIKAEMIAVKELLDVFLKYTK